MLMVVKRNIKYLTQCIKYNLLVAKEYRTSFIIQTIFMFINNGFFLIFWIILFRANDNSMNGITMNDILYLWSLPTISYGISFFVFGGTDNISKNIITGQFDMYMIYPKHPLVSIITSRSDFSAFGDLTYGLVLGLFATNFDIGKYLLLILFSTLGTLFFVFSNVIIQMLSVWFGDVSDVADKYKHNLLVTFSIYPETIFNKYIKILLYTVIPTAYIAYVPIKLIQYFTIKNLLLFTGASIVYIVIAISVYNFSIKRYESGNSMMLRD